MPASRALSSGAPQRSFYAGDFNGTVFAFCEMILRMEKPLAFSKPFPPEEEEELRQCAEENTKRFKLRYYLEKNLLLTKLFASVEMTGQWVYIFYQEEEDLNRYFELKTREAELIAAGGYTEEKREELSWKYGRLMGYKEEAIRRLIEGEQEKESNEENNSDTADDDVDGSGFCGVWK